VDQGLVHVEEHGHRFAGAWHGFPPAVMVSGERPYLRLALHRCSPETTATARQVVVR